MLETAIKHYTAIKLRNMAALSRIFLSYIFNRLPYFGLK